MEKFNEICGQLFVYFLVLYLMYIVFFFLGGRYSNEKIECVKRHESVETKYNIITGCWYWDENIGRMVKDKNKSKTQDIKSLPTNSDGWKTLPNGIRFREVDESEACIQKDKIVDGEQIYVSTDGDGRKFKEIDEEKEKTNKQFMKKFMTGMK